MIDPTPVVVVSEADVGFFAFMLGLTTILALTMWISAIRTSDKIRNRIEINWEKSAPVGAAVGVPMVGLLLGMLLHVMYALGGAR